MISTSDSEASSAASPSANRKEKRKSAVAERFRRLLSRTTLWQRVLGGAVLLPALLAGGAGAAYYYKLHRICGEMTLEGLPVTLPPQSSRRLLVISPHCDDETLGAGSLIANARRNGAEVTVAFLTNGDGFRVAASRTLHEVAVGPSDFVRFAEVRQKEAISALGQLGVPESHVQFFGYPDRGLRPMWESNWEPEHPFRSGFTGHTHVPYPRAFTPHAVYCGASLTADLKRLMEQTQPTDILVTHPSDDHPDHNAAPAFAEAALQECRSTGDRWAKAARLHFYIVHRGDWPLPQGFHPDQPLLPPPGLVTRDTRWNVFHSSTEDRKAKQRALDQYVSQTEVAGRFLWSFVRSNELMADLPTPTVSDGAEPGTLMQRNGTEENSAATKSAPVSAGIQAEAPATCETASDGPYGDSLVRYVEPSADLTGLTVSREGKNLHVRLTTRGVVSPRLRYQLLVRGIETDIHGAPVTSFMSETVKPTLADAGAGRHQLETLIPLSRLGLDKTGHDRVVWISAESRWANRLPLIDRTGYRQFVLETGISESKHSGNITVARIDGKAENSTSGE